MKSKVFILISVMIVLSWMGFIIYLTLQPAPQSAATSSVVVDTLINSLDRTGVDILANMSRIELHRFIRKAAHFLAYFILGILTFHLILKLTGDLKKSFVITMLISISYAAFDETVQTFVPGRGGQVGDIIIDGAGAAAGIAFYLLALKVKQLVFRS